MIYGSVCSGIEAATVAWHGLGWRPAFFSEIEKFPRSVLAHHYPDVPLHGDFTTIQAGDYEPIDLLVGGTPCQSFSIAGLRAGLDDDRGNLALEYLRLADLLRPRWLVWENVPGVLSSLSHQAPDPSPPPPPMDLECGGQEVETEDVYDSEELHAFQCFLAGLSELGYGFACRVLDAQYFGVPQRRRRVFVVGYLGDWRPASAVLFERHSLQGHSAPSREAGPTVAALTSNGVGTCGADDNQAQGGHLIAFGGNNTSGPINVATALNACSSASGRMDFESETFIAHTLRGEGFDASEDGSGRGVPIVPVVFDCKASAGFQAVSESGISPTLRSMASASGHQNAGGQLAVAYPIQEVGKRTGASTDDVRAGIGVGDDGDVMFALQAGAQHGVFAFDLRGRDGGAMVEGMHDPANIRAASGGSSRSYVSSAMAVRRLTPRECERLQGFPDDYTRIPWRGKAADQCPDGPRYRALGNSMAVPVMAWIGGRIQAVDNILAQAEAAE
ncbi:MAG: DNA (cytosine-5-)-methyltransferase [Alphaproteobacteria bacterium]|nr:DNA (cytosine-5-)-methyltransferase [Alphaproteobacteria bacterium]